MNKLIRVFSIGSTATAAAALLALTGAPAGADDGPAAAAPAHIAAAVAAQPTQEPTLPQIPLHRGDIESVSPGHVAFAMTASGRWLGFGARGSGRTLFDRAGIVVLAQSAAGGAVTVADTRGDDVRELRGMRSLGVVHEGARAGARYPSARPDDDGDGRVDEDPLDGIDNDGDGQVDEDYAAIGDEMIVAGCETSADASPAVGDGAPVPPCTVSLRQECYAWSLAHIDDMVAIKVTVRNTGEAPLEGVRIGAVIGRDDAVELSTRALGGMSADAFETPLVAKSMVLDDGQWPALAAVFASEGESRNESSWLTGEMRADRRIADVVAAADRPDALARPDRPQAGGTEPSAGPSPTNAAAGTSVYGVSPVLGTLEPGDEAHVYIALVAVPSDEHAERIIDDAFRTIRGDEGHRMIPPPMSITRRNLWGSYRLRVPSDPTAGLTLTLTNPREQQINPVEINQIEGLDLRGATRTESPNGDVTFGITGAVPDDVAASERVVLSGRTQGGEMFNAVLRPEGVAGEVSVESARRFWNTPGKLEEALLSGSPNPFRDATTIYYEIPGQIVDENGTTIQFNGTVETSVKVYNVAGRLVSNLVETSNDPGRYQTQWTAQDEAGTDVASGVYYVKLQIGKRFVTKRLIQLK